MKLYFSCLGLISFIVLGALAEESIKVSRDIVTKASPDVIMAPEDKVNVTLNCTGSRRDVSYYFRNRITWTYIKEDGTSKDLTTGFFLSDNIDTNKMKLEFGADIPPELGDSGYLFSLTITGVTRADDGIYKCSLLAKGDTVIDSKELKVTVVNPVQTVSIELHDAQKNLISKSSTPARQNGATVKISPGKYKVKCVATGSNPEPVMNLFLNQQSHYVAVKTKRVEGAQFREYEGSFEVQSLTINAQNSPQLLTCTANILNGDKNAEAGLTLIVRIEETDVDYSDKVILTVLIGIVAVAVVAGLVTVKVFQKRTLNSAQESTVAAGIAAEPYHENDNPTTNLRRSFNEVDGRKYDEVDGQK